MRLVSLTAAVFGAAFLCGPKVHAAQYQLEVIARPGDAIEGRTIELFSIDPTDMAIGDDGEVAFFAYASGPEGAGWSLMTQRRFIAGAGKVVDGYVPTFNDEDHGIDMNALGEVVYTPILGPAHRGVFVNERLVFQVGDVIDGRTIEFVGRSPEINDLGTVVVEAWSQENLGPAIFTQHAVVAEAGQRIGNVTLGDLFVPSIDAQDRIVFFARIIEGNEVSLVSAKSVVVSPGDRLHGYSVTAVRGGFVTDWGEVVMLLVGTDDGGSEAAIIATPNEVLWRPGTEVGGIAFDHLNTPNIVYNEQEQLAYMVAELGDDGRPSRRLLIAGDTVVAAEGDLLDGKIIQRIRAFDMNDRGTVAFRVQFDDYSGAIVVGTRIVPEPAAHRLAFVALALVCAIRCRRVDSRCRMGAKDHSTLPPRGGSESQDRQSGGVSCVCRSSIARET